MRRSAPILFGLIAVMHLAGQAAEIQYVDGLLETQRGSSWEEVLIGDRLPSSAVLKLAQGSYAEIASGTQIVKLSEAGQYVLSDLLEVSQTLTGWNVGSVVSSKLTALSGKRPSREDQAAQMGVRGAAQGQSELAWMEDEGAELKKESLDLMESGEYVKARKLLQDAIDISLDDQEEAEYRFYAAYAEEMMGQRAEALRLLDGIQPDPMADYFGDYTLLHGRLLVETHSFQRALAVLDSFLAAHSQGTTPQIALILAAAAHTGSGETVAARARLEKATSLDPNSPAGKKARELLAGL